VGGTQRDGGAVLEGSGARRQIGSVGGQDPLQGGQTRIRFDGDVGPHLERAERVFGSLTKTVAWGRASRSMALSPVCTHRYGRRDGRAAVHRFVKA
jgi:hypothetical protein